MRNKFPSRTAPDVHREKKAAGKFAKSAQLFKESGGNLAGGVSSLLRASSKPVPLFFRSASGSKLTDVDGNRYIDYGLAWGPLILGHCPAAVLGAVRRQMKKFHLLGAQHGLEIAVARRIRELVPCADLVAFSNTGSEAVQVALRLARACTGRQKIIKFEGHYHGWFDNILISYHSKGPRESSYTPMTESEGQCAALTDVLILPWNDSERLEAALRDHHQEIAAIITEPILCNSGCLLPVPGYLQRVRELASHYGIVLIFDEVITGFRVALGGAQSLFAVTPDLATFGKAVAAGFPLSVIAGRRDIMELIAQHRVVHAGTFNGNPISLAAAAATLEILAARDGLALKRADDLGKALIRGIREEARRVAMPILINGVGTAFSVVFTHRTQLQNYRDTLDADRAVSDRFIETMLQNGIYLLPDGRWYISAAHTKADVRRTLGAVRQTFSVLKEELDRDCGPASPNRSESSTEAAPTYHRPA